MIVVTGIQVQPGGDRSWRIVNLRIAGINIDKAILVQVAHGTRFDLVSGKQICAQRERPIAVVEIELVLRADQQQINPAVIVKVAERYLNDRKVLIDSAQSRHVGEGSITIVPHQLVDASLVRRIDHPASAFGDV